VSASASIPLRDLSIGSRLGPPPEAALAADFLGATAEKAAADAVKEAIKRVVAYNFMVTST